MKRLYATVDPTEAGAIRGLLRDAGIESSLDPQEGGHAVNINVRDEDAAAAAEILAGHFEKTEPPEAGEPPPTTPEESEAFEAKRGPSRTVVLVLFFVLVPLLVVLAVGFARCST